MLNINDDDFLFDVGSDDVSTGRGFSETAFKKTSVGRNTETGEI